MPKNMRQDELTAAIRGDVPRQPGVYLFYDRCGNTIYVGKSVNLRQRMLSYFRCDRSGVEDRIRQMVFNIDEFGFRETHTELLALLLEDVLIKRELPLYNIRQREYEACRYLALTDDPFPAFKVLERQDAANGVVFGPFRDEYLVEDVLHIVRRHFRLRSCTDPRPSRKCLNFDLSICAGPCRGEVSVEEYAQLVGRAADFLNGDDAGIVGKLEQEMAKFAASCSYEKAAELKRHLDFSRNFCARQRFIQKFRSESLCLQEQVDERFTYRFVNGNLVDLERFGESSNGRGFIPVELLQTQTDARFLLDRANVVYDWLNRDKAARIVAF